jgi:hypothetical protein
MHFGIYDVFYTQNIHNVLAILRELGKLACQCFTHWTNLEALLE